MNRRYVYRTLPAGLEATLRAIPGAVVTLSEGVLEVVVPEVAVVNFDRNQPAAASEIEDVDGLTPRLTATVRADLLEVLRSARDGSLTTIRAALDALVADSRTRTRGG